MKYEQNFDVIMKSWILEIKLLIFLDRNIEMLCLLHEAKSGNRPISSCKKLLLKYLQKNKNEYTDSRVVRLSKFYLTVSGIIMPSLNSVIQFQQA